jgi:hypothetical protein
MLTRRAFFQVAVVLALSRLLPVRFTGSGGAGTSVPDPPEAPGPSIELFRMPGCLIGEHGHRLVCSSCYGVMADGMCWECRGSIEDRARLM